MSSLLNISQIIISFMAWSKMCPKHKNIYSSSELIIKLAAFLWAQQQSDNTIEIGSHQIPQWSWRYQLLQQSDVCKIKLKPELTPTWFIKTFVFQTVAVFCVLDDNASFDLAELTDWHQAFTVITTASVCQKKLHHIFLQTHCGFQLLNCLFPFSAFSVLTRSNSWGASAVGRSWQRFFICQPFIWFLGQLLFLFSLAADWELHQIYSQMQG